jgi:hypothetical protein
VLLERLHHTPCRGSFFMHERRHAITPRREKRPRALADRSCRPAASRLTRQPPSVSSQPPRRAARWSGARARAGVGPQRIHSGEGAEHRRDVAVPAPRARQRREPGCPQRRAHAVHPRKLPSPSRSRRCPPRGSPISQPEKARVDAPLGLAARPVPPNSRCARVGGRARASTGVRRLLPAREGWAAPAARAGGRAQLARRPRRDRSA